MRRFVQELVPSLKAQMKETPNAHPAAPKAMKTFRHVPRNPSIHSTASPDTMSPT